jgi:N-acetylmuramoyl-L-alanine amidase
MFTSMRFLPSVALRYHRDVHNSLAKACLLHLILFAAVAQSSIAAQPSLSAAGERAQLGTEPSRERFCVALDVGHLPSAPGAMAADGKMEYEFNRHMVELIAANLQRDDRIRVVVVNAAGKRISLSGRATAAKAAGADLLLSIHHDSVNDRYLEAERQPNGRVLYHCDRFSGYSVFYSKKTGTLCIAWSLLKHSVLPCAGRA